MPFSLALLVLPISLHQDSRNIILKHSRSYFLKTVAENPQMLIGFAERARSLLPYTLEGFGFVMQHNSFEVTEVGRLQTADRGIRKKVDGTKESVDCQRVARIVGKNFARINDRVTIYTTLGVRP